MWLEQHQFMVNVYGLQAHMEQNINSPNLLLLTNYGQTFNYIFVTLRSNTLRPTLLCYNITLLKFTEAINGNSMEEL